MDDNATNRHILEEWLRDWQMNPTAVGDGVAAMDVLWDAASAGRPYPLVLLDARMPDTDGLALAARIRERAALSAIRIILLTSGDRPGDAVRSRELRIDAHLLKPVQPDELLETIYRVMNGARGGAPPPAEPPPAPEPVPEAAPAIAPLHILVAEDNEFSARFLERLLTRPGHRVQLASNGREALALAEEKGFDLLLLDVHMPELDGFQVVQELRGRERTAGGHLPIIALTARSRREDRERCLAAGMDDFLTKPVRPAELLAAIDRLVRAPGGSHGVSPPGRRHSEERRHLLDPVAVLIACGDDAEWLRGMCQDFQTYVPARLAEMGEALRDRDAPRLREAAHKLCALLFSVLHGGGRRGIGPRRSCGSRAARRGPAPGGTARSDGPGTLGAGGRPVPRNATTPGGGRRPLTTATGEECQKRHTGRGGVAHGLCSAGPPAQHSAHEQMSTWER